MSKTTYTIRGSNTTTAIKYAPIIIQNIWRAGTDAGANIIRVRVAKERDEKTKGRTFFGYQQQLGNPTMGATVASTTFGIILIGVLIYLFAFQKRISRYQY